MATPNFELETINVLSDSESTYNQIVTEIINKTNNNNEKIDAMVIDGGTF